MITGHAATLWTSTGPALANHLWQSTVFATAAWLTTFLLRRNQAQVRYGLWVAASLKFLIPFSLLIGLGALLPEPQRVGSAPGTAVYSALDIASQPFSDMAPLQVPPTAHAAGLVAAMAAWLPVVFFTVWLCGAATVLLVWYTRWDQVSAVMRRAIPVEDGREMQTLRRLESLSGPSRVRVLLRRSQQLMEPGIFGTFQPVLLWPERLSEHLDDEQIEAILTHEIMHARRYDNLVALIHMFVEAAFWFHPMVWWVERHMVEERERACDEAVVQLGCRPDVYAESLLKACRLSIESPLTCICGIAGADLDRRIQSIMTLRLERLSRSTKLVLCALGLVVVLGPVALGLMRRIPAYSQILVAAGPRPSFEVATIKPSKPDEIPTVKLLTRDGYYAATQISLTELVKYAYQVKLDDQLVGASGWMNGEYFDVEAKAGEAEIESLRKLPVMERIEQFRLMLQSLLEDRFQLKVTSKLQELPAYALVVAKGGPRLKEVTVSPGFSSAAIPPPPPPPPTEGSALSLPKVALARGPYPEIRKTGPNQVTATACRMSWFADWLLSQGEMGNRVVVDQTGLRGNYDFVLNGISAEPSALPGARQTPPDEFTVSIFTALQQQLGLKLVPTKAPVEVLVVDRVEPPSAN